MYNLRIQPSTTAPLNTGLVSCMENFFLDHLFWRTLRARIKRP